MNVLKEHPNKKYPLYKKRYELVTTPQQGETNVAWAIRVKTGMRNAELDKVTAEEFMLSWVVAHFTLICAVKFIKCIGLSDTGSSVYCLPRP